MRNTSETLLIIAMGHENDENGVLSEMFKLRLQGAIREYRKHPGARVLVQGGFGHFNRSSHSSAHHASKYLIEQGVSVSDILTRHHTNSTVSEAFSAWEISQANPKTPLCVVTSYCHIVRTQFVFEHFFDPDQLQFVATPDGVTSDELFAIRQHEQDGMKLIRDQGGVIWNGELFKLRKWKTKPAEILILPMNGGNDKNGVVSGKYEMRLLGALEVYNKNPNSKILVQGGFGHFNTTAHSSAYYGSRHLMDKGVDESDLFVKHATSSTVEEALSARRFVQSYPAENICVVTSNFHLERTQLIFEHFFASEQMQFVGTPDGVSPDELAKWKTHEAEGLALLREQQGVILEGKLFKRRNQKS